MRHPRFIEIIDSTPLFRPPSPAQTMSKEKKEQNGEHAAVAASRQAEILPPLPPEAAGY